jgi:hypothetical protein
MTRVTTTVVMVSLMAATSVRLTGQDLRIDPSQAAAVRVSVETLSQHVLQFAGLRVVVADAIVERAVSSRAFILIGQRDVAGLGGRDRLGVIVVDGTALVVGNMPVVVTGAAATFTGAQVGGVLARASPLTEAERDGLYRYPLVVALSVETPGNLNLVRPLSTVP